MIRLVTLLVLMISDMDVVFSTLFQYNLWMMGGFCHFFLGVTQVGNASYALGVFVYGPRQKYKTMDIVKEMMVQNRSEFIGKDQHGREVQVDMTSVVDPRSRAPRPKTFADLENTSEGKNEFECGMAAYELLHMWTAALRKNARNCCERKHGVPFYRVAKFGYMSEPTPMDLGGILNANALYTFATGILQMTFGAFIFHQNGPSINTVLPLMVSLVSLVLSFLNVLLNFSAILAELESERRMSETILHAAEGDRAKGHAEIKTTLDDDVNAVKAKYIGRQDSCSIAAKEQDIETARDRFQIEMLNVDRNNIEVLEIQLTNHRHRLARIKDVQAGRVQPITATNRTSHVEEFHKATAVWEEQLRSNREWGQNQIKGIDANGLSAAELKAATEAITKEVREKEAVFQAHLDQVKADFSKH